MPLFVLFCVDKPKSLAVRMAARADHLAYAAERSAMLKLGGPLLDEAGDMAGSLVILDAPDLAAATAFNTHDPYTLAGLWASVDIKPFRASIGSL